MAKKKQSHGTKESQCIEHKPVALFFSKNLEHFVLAGFIFLCFYPVLSVWYYGDDVVSKDIHAIMRYENKNLLDFFTNQMEYYVIKLGRFFPVHIIQRFLTFYFLNTITKYRVYILIMNSFAVFCFAIMTRTYSGSNRLFYAVLVLFPGVFFALSRYDDAAIGYFMFIQTLIIYLSVSLIMLKKYSDTGKKRFILFSLLLYLLSLLTYELPYLLVLAYPLAAFYLFAGERRNRIKKTVNVSLPYFVMAFCCFLIYIYFSLNSVHSYDGISFNPDIGKIAITSLKQVTAAFPGSSGFFSNGNLQFRFTVNNILSGIKTLDIITTLALPCILPVFIGSHRKVDFSLPGTRFLIGLSFLLVACPAIIIGLSRKYQQNLDWGQGYLTIYIIRFGLLIMFFFIYEFISGHIKWGIVRIIFIALIIFLVQLLHLFVLQENRKVLQYKNQTSYLRLVAEKSIDAGLLKDIPDQSIILLGNIWYDYPYFTRNSIFSNYCACRVTTDTIRSFIDMSWQKYGEEKTYQYDNDHVFYFHSCKYLSNTGYAFCGKLKTLTVNNANIAGMYATEFKLFYSGDECDAVDILVWEDNDFIMKRIPLKKYGYTGYTMEINNLVDIMSIEFVGKIKPSIWQP